ncbi:hypothetical protein TSMEX_008840 [Taenia solium]|eukprot:TsM_000051500 transcript=TsM_000051500 gene=TsM_000051500
MSSETIFSVVLWYIWAPDCAMQEAPRTSALYEIQQYPQINLGNAKERRRAQPYQFSRYSQVLSSTSVFVNHPINSSHGSLIPTIAAVSVVVQRKTLLQGALVYLVSSGWKRIALFYDMHTIGLDILELFDYVLTDFSPIRTILINLMI